MVGIAYQYSIGKIHFNKIELLLNPDVIDFAQFKGKNKRFKAPPIGLYLVNV